MQYSVGLFGVLFCFVKGNKTTFCILVQCQVVRLWYAAVFSKCRSFDPTDQVDHYLQSVTQFTINPVIQNAVCM